jgi:hypothetical protein
LTAAYDDSMDRLNTVIEPLINTGSMLTQHLKHTVLTKSQRLVEKVVIRQVEGTNLIALRSYSLGCASISPGWILFWLQYCKSSLFAFMVLRKGTTTSQVFDGVAQLAL